MLCLGGVLHPAVFAIEFLHSSCGIHESLLSREERVAARTDLDMDRPLCGAGLIDGTARARNRTRNVFRMDILFHGFSFWSHRL